MEFALWYIWEYRVTTISRLLKMVGLFCKRALQKRLYSAQETYNSKEPTNRSHLISVCIALEWQRYLLNNLIRWFFYQIYMRVSSCIAVWWQKLVGSLNLSVSFAKYSLFNRALLQKRPIILRSLFVTRQQFYCSLIYYGLATISRLLKTISLFLQNIVFFIGLFCKRDL